MNVDRIINMVMRQITRRLVNGGINKGINVASSFGKSKNEYPEATQSKQDTQQVKKAARVASRSTKL